MRFPNISLGLEWNELKKFERLELKEKSIVFYAENKASFNHFKLLIEELTNNMNLTVCYVTSIKDDKIFEAENKKIYSFYIGDGTARTKFFLTLKAKILVMDMPDLDKYHVKRSKVYPVHYVYLFHSIFSVHSYLRNGALDNYDTIFCVGQHHIDEIREIEKKYSIKQKILVNYGFGQLDWLLGEVKKFRNNEKIHDKELIIIAPSYGEKNLLEVCGIELIDILLRSDFKVILRPHFRILRDSKELIKSIRTKFKNNSNFLFEEGVIKPEDFHSSKCMITDWSGIGLDYAFTCENKVMFIDVPKKIMNDEHQSIPLEPIEIAIREKIGYVISPKDLGNIPKLIKKNDNKIDGIEEIRSQTVFNVGKSARIGAEYIQKINMDD
tara:strand:- start:17 stop:1162 length:1146 start_codon:yes stop_codon:yes gene_type:complete